MKYTQDIKFCFADKIGKNGITKSEFSRALKLAGDAVADISEEYQIGGMECLRVANRLDDLAEINNTAKKIKKSFKHLVIIGTGGSSFSGKIFTSLQQLGLEKTTLSYFDNVDPHTINNTLGSLNLAKTMFLAISKSGSTLETVSIFLACLNEAIKKVGKKAARKHFLIITDEVNGKNSNPLREIGKQHEIHVLDHEKAIGGRFSALTNVGLLPAAISGLNITKIRKAAKDAIAKNLSCKKIDLSPGAVGAAVNLCLMSKEYGCNIFMPYIDRLDGLANWYCQVWAESIGKKGFGNTPVKAMGTIDQHSQLQLYLDGPQDKFFTLIMTDQRGKGRKIPAALLTKHKPLGYIKNRTIGDIITAEQKATFQTLTQHKLPVRAINLNKLDEETIGQLFVHFCLETIITGKVLGINPFDQPAVEEGKAKAREFLKRLR